ncbi:MAG: S8 family serine peptidase, partial [Anaerolineae bacterium]
MTKLRRPGPVLTSLSLALTIILLLSGRRVAARNDANGFTLSKNLGHRIYLKSREFTPPAGLTAQEHSLLSAQAAEAMDGRLHVLLQFDQHPDTAQRAQLARQGVHLLTYLPDHTWYASVPASMTAAGQVPPGARWMGAIRPDDRISPALKRALPAPGTPLRLYLKVHPDVTLNAATAAVKSVGGTVLSAAPEFHRLHVEVPGPESLPALAASDPWYWVTRESPPRRVLNDGSRAATRTTQAQAAGYHGNPASAPGSIVLAIWDAGKAATTHAGLAGRLRFGDDGLASDEHATHVAGTMAGNGAGSPGRRDLRGHADQAVIVSYDWDNSVVEHRFAISSYDIDVSQNSWGFLVPRPCIEYGDYDDDTLGPAYDAIVNGIYGKRISVVFAAGNSQWHCAGGWDTIGPPAGGENTVSVGATNSDDKSMTDFSSWGPVNDGRVKPDVVAPGCEARGEKEIWSARPPNSYGGFCGTSMAAPAVTGILGLFLEAYNVTYGNDPWPSTLKAVLMHTAEDLGNPGPDYRFGYGHVDAEAGIDLITATGDGNSSLNIRQDSVENGEIRTYELNSDSNDPLKCTLVWDDKEGTSSSTRALINNLDLRLIGPDGTAHLPWVLYPESNPGRAATTGDNDVDNVEQVVVNNPEAGQWTVQVIGDSVPLGPEEYSLVCPFGQVAGPTSTPTLTNTPTSTNTPTATPTATSTATVPP